MAQEIKEKIERIIKFYVSNSDYLPEMYDTDITDITDKLVKLFEEEKQKLIEDIKDLQIKVSSPNSEYINKLPQIQILDEVLEIIEREIKK